MNEAIYQLADSGGSVRIVIQKKLSGDFILGVSNGRDTPLICQGERQNVDVEFEAALPGYLEKLKGAAIEARLRAATEESEETDDEAESEAPAASEKPSPTPPKKDEQLELDFGF
ncbi:MAG: hypothetical protein BWY31_03462 [Lentisphaerae bacterium ADurb.Bin242]|nr:MAG: hypothetical protein BWY31_03462 [Lentisphaerae bacterium ADurb.Bin242]